MRYDIYIYIYTYIYVIRRLKVKDVKDVKVWEETGKLLRKKERATEIRTWYLPNLSSGD